MVISQKGLKGQLELQPRRSAEFEIMELSVEERQGVTFLRLCENITFSNTREFKDVLDQTVEAGVVGIVLDMEQVSFINSTGIGIIAAAFNSLKARQGTLVILRPRPEVARVLKIIGFDTMMHVTNDEQKALDFCL